MPKSPKRLEVRPYRGPTNGHVVMAAGFVVGILAASTALVILTREKPVTFKVVPSVTVPDQLIGQITSLGDSYKTLAERSCPAPEKIVVHEPAVDRHRPRSNDADAPRRRHRSRHFYGAYR
jgi:hypothetical protein